MARLGVPIQVTEKILPKEEITPLLSDSNEAEARGYGGLIIIGDIKVQFPSE